MPRKASDNFLLVQLFSPIWAEFHGGEEYQADGRDWRETTTFLQIHPDVFEKKREIFVQRAREYMQDPFYDQPFNKPPLNHQMFFLLKNFASFGKVKMPEKKKRKRCGVHNLWYDGNFCPKCFVPVKQEEMR